ncbi:MAG: hypothetical protein HRT38_10435 [Alteromonadaceae bacterium]|nr:hypothetical protein [Alteromonadaceae bacterium]
MIVLALKKQLTGHPPLKAFRFGTVEGVGSGLVFCLFAFLSRITRQDLTPHPVNNRQLPKDISDVLGAEVAINQSYTYDYQGNITSLIDNARSGFSLHRGIAGSGIAGSDLHNLLNK